MRNIFLLHRRWKYLQTVEPRLFALFRFAHSDCHRGHDS